MYSSSLGQTWKVQIETSSMSGPWTLYKLELEYTHTLCSPTSINRGYVQTISFVATIIHDWGFTNWGFARLIYVKWRQRFWGLWSHESMNTWNTTNEYISNNAFLMLERKVSLCYIYQELKIANDAGEPRQHTPTCRWSPLILKRVGYFWVKGSI